MTNYPENLQSIQQILPDYENSDIKWGSKELNDITQHQPLTKNYRPYLNSKKTVDYDDYYKVLSMAEDYLNDLCRNTVVATVALKLVLTSILKDWDKACSKNNEKEKYKCWLRWHRTFHLISIMNLGTGAYGNYYSTFENISKIVNDITNRSFLIKWSNKSTKGYKELRKLECVYDTFKLTKEEKEKIKKQYSGYHEDVIFENKMDIFGENI